MVLCLQCVIDPVILKVRASFKMAEHYLSVIIDLSYASSTKTVRVVVFIRKKNFY